MVELSVHVSVVLEDETPENTKEVGAEGTDGIHRKNRPAANPGIAPGALALIAVTLADARLVVAAYEDRLVIEDRLLSLAGLLLFTHPIAPRSAAPV